jgi:hypothetical protein
LAKEWRNGFILAVNERVGPLNAEPPTLELSNYSRLLDNTDTCVPKESDTLADELALTSFSYSAKEPETSANELVFTLFLHPIEDDILANKLDHTIYAKPITSKKRLGTGSKTVSKDPRYGTSISSRRRQSKK